MTLEELNAAPEYAARDELLRCCGSTRWARQMTEARPFSTVEALAETADKIWRGLARSDWLEAFAAHPRIGESSSAGGEPWSEREQSGVRTASAQVRDRLAAANREYEARFGYIFIVCATGKSAGEMLEILEHRLTNRPEEELPIAAEEQRKIMQLRLVRLLAPRV